MVSQPQVYTTCMTNPGPLMRRKPCGRPQQRPIQHIPQPGYEQQPQSSLKYVLSSILESASCTEIRVLSCSVPATLPDFCVLMHTKQK